MSWGYGWAPYVPVAERRRKAMQKIDKMKKKGQVISPVENVCRGIAKTFWGKAWCDNLEAYSDYANRLPRGRTYVRNGSVVDLQISEGQVEAIVSGSDLYRVKIAIHPLKKNVWQAIQKECAGKIASLVDLLSGRLAGPVMEIVTQKQTGLFPMPQEMSFSCSCPDWASMCKHVSAVLYGVGARLDHKPELLFSLRGVNHVDLIYTPAEIDTTLSGGVKDKIIAADQLSEIFGIDIDTGVGDARTITRKRSGHLKTVDEKKKRIKQTAQKARQKSQQKEKETVVVKKTEKKEIQQKPTKRSATPAKKSATVTEERTGKKVKKQPPKQTTAKTGAKKNPSAPKSAVRTNKR
jgi:uncharacterized Zn finger protein